MHRSGTSVLAGSLQLAGLALGEVVTKAPHNPLGNRENRAIMFMQEDLLTSNGGSWEEPPEIVRWQPSHRDVRDRFISQFIDERHWGFKDPRTLFTLEGWLDVLPTAELVGIFRHPILVARSLERRDGFSTQKALNLWERYNLRLLSLHRRQQFPLVEFHTDSAALLSNLRQLFLDLDLPNGSRGLTFFEEDLRHDLQAEAPIPDSTKRVYAELKQRARIKLPEPLGPHT